LGLAVFLCASLSAATNASADDDYRERFGKGKKHVGLSLGAGTGFSMGFQGDGDGRNVNFFDLRPRFGVGISEDKGVDKWYLGNWDILLEGEFLFEFDHGTYQGVALLFRYNFLSGSRFFPFFDFGSGIGNLDFDLDDQDDGFSFSPQFGPGFHYFVGERVSLDSAVRYHHISNAGTHKPNNSINDITFTVGFSYFLD
jgi:opacity protein-like surface antigen